MTPKDFPISLDIKQSFRKTNYELVTNDTKAYQFVFKIYDGSKMYDYDEIVSATIKYVRPDNLETTRNLTNTGNDLRIMVELEEIAVAGTVKAEVHLYGTNGERITTSWFSFTVRNELGNGTPITEIEEYPVLTQLITDTTQLKNTLNANVQISTEKITEINNKIEEVEVIKTAYDNATKANLSVEVSNARKGFNTLNDRLNSVDTQLSEKATKTELQAVASGSPKGAYVTLTALQTAFPTGNSNIYLVTADGNWYFWNGSAWTAGGVYQSTGIANDSIDTSYIKGGAVTLKKTTIDIFPRDIHSWESAIGIFAVGQQISFPISGYKPDSLNYRHDTINLIKVNPNTILTFTGASESAYKVAVWEFDVNKFGIKDSGYQTDKLVLSGTTEYIHLICARKDNAYHTISDIVANANIAVEIPVTSVSQIIEGDTSETVNLMKLSENLWEYGTANISGGVLTYYAGTTRIRLKQGVYIEGLNNYKRLYYNAPENYKIAFIWLDNSNTPISESGFKIGGGYIYTPRNTSKAVCIIAYISDSEISVNTLKITEFILSNKETSFKYSESDLTGTIKEVRYSSDAKLADMKFSDKVRYIGHSGTANYAPENTIEAYKIANIMGMWGLESDVQITSDGYLVMIHDDTVDRTTNGTGNVKDLTLAQIKAFNIDVNLKGFTNVKVPTIDEYLGVCKKYGMYPIIEIKSATNENVIADALLNTLKNYNMLQNCIVFSFSLNILEYIRLKNSYINLAYILTTSDVITNDFITSVKTLGNCGLAVYGTTNITKAMINSCHVEGIPVLAWTIDDKTIADYLESINVDMIITNTLFNPNRNKKKLNITFTTNDNCNTFNITSSPLRETATITKVDNYMIEVLFDSFHSVAISAFSAVGEVRNITDTNVGIFTQTIRRSTGGIGVRFYVGGVQKALSELPSYMHLYCEVII